jgi:hypothetical protein
MRKQQDYLVDQPLYLLGIKMECYALEMGRLSASNKHIIVVNIFINISVKANTMQKLSLLLLR